MSLHEFANPTFVKQILGGDFAVSDSILLMAAVTIQLPISMIVLSRVLPNQMNWIANILVAVFTIGSEVMNNPNPDLDNMFFLLAELIAFVSIIVISISWRAQFIKENRSQSMKGVQA